MAKFDQLIPMDSIALRALNLHVAEYRSHGSLTRADVDPAEHAHQLSLLAIAQANMGEREKALAAAQEAVTLRRALAALRPDAFDPALAMSLNDLANFLSELGEREKALAAAQEAVTLHRALVVRHLDAFTPDLATSLNNLANRLNDLGEHEKALAAAQEA